MNILICVPSLDKAGGVSSYYGALKDKFCAGVEYFIVGARPGNRNWFQNIWRFLKDNYVFYRRIAQKEYDIVHVNPSLDFKSVVRDGILLLIAKRFGRKVVVFFPGWRKSFEAKLRRYFSPLFKFVYFRADAVVVLSSEFKEVLEQLEYSKQVYVVTTVVDDDLFAKARGVSLSSKFRKDSLSFSILFLSRVEKFKGIYETLDTYKLLKGRIHHLRLTVVGDGSELAAARAYAAAQLLEGVEFLGHVTPEAKARILSEADLFILPSHGEGMPISMLEAMAFGLPVVTRPVGGIKDFFEEGKMGFLTGSLDPAEFVPLVEKLALDHELRSTIAHYNREYAEEHFSASSVVRRIENIYEEVLNGK